MSHIPKSGPPAERGNTDPMPFKGVESCNYHFHIYTNTKTSLSLNFLNPFPCNRRDGPELTSVETRFQLKTCGMDLAATTRYVQRA